jgi:ACS family tartrate transporter-like MFS transporter
VKSMERDTITKVWWRIVPLLASALVLDALDRGNLALAAVQMKQALGLSNAALGVAGGFVGIGYAIAAIPSTLALQRVGARRWMSLLMFVWGLCSAGTALVANRGELAFARVLLGIAEAGFAPGLILYLTYWLPSEYRGRVLASILMVNSLVTVISGPMGSGLLSLDGFLGLAGWKWLFLAEGLPTVVLACVVFRFLPDRPVDARWLTPPQRDWLTERLAAQAQSVAALQGHRIGWRALTNVWVVLLAVAYLGMLTGGNVLGSFLPLIVRKMGFSVGHVGFVLAVPPLLAMLSQPLWGLWSDRAQRREIVVVVGCVMQALGLCCAGALLPSPWALVPLTVAVIARLGTTAPFWSLPPAFLTGTSAAAGIALINLTGNFASFTGPSLMGWASDATGSYGGGLIVGAIPVVVSAAILAAMAFRSVRPAIAVGGVLGGVPGGRPPPNS